MVLSIRVVVRMHGGNMEIFLFSINTIAGLDTWVDRDLISKISSFTENDKQVNLTVEINQPPMLRKLLPKKTYAFQYEYSSGEKELKYFILEAFEIIPPPKKSEIYNLILYIKKLEIEAK